MVCFHDGQEGITIHDRHDDIQQDKGYPLSKLPQHPNSLLSVLCFLNIIVSGQNLAQQAPVKCIVFHHQNLLT